MRETRKTMANHVDDCGTHEGSLCTCPNHHVTTRLEGDTLHVQVTFRVPPPNKYMTLHVRYPQPPARA